MNTSSSPGDLAMIKQCKTYPALVGRCVELIQMVPPGASTAFEGRKFSQHAPCTSWLVHYGRRLPD